MTLDRFVADCARCFGLCCTALAFQRSADFPVDKSAGSPCGHLDEDYRCGIHPRLREHGFRGCVSFDCLGAGQVVSQEVFHGRSWRDAADGGRSMFEVFGVVRQLQDVLYHLEQARALPITEALRRQVEEAIADGEATLLLPPDALRAVDPAVQRGGAAPLLREASRQARDPGGVDLAGHDLAGRDLRRTDLCRADLRGTVLIAADLRDCDLRLADLLGADLRDADLRGAALAGALYLSPAQVGGAHGDARTTLPVHLAAPAHWGG